LVGVTSQPGDDGHQAARLERDAEGPRPDQDLGGGPAVVDEPGQERPVALPFEALAVALDEPAQRQRRGAPLEEHDVARRGRLVADEDEPAPVVAAGTDHGHEPGRPRAVPGAVGDLDRPRPCLPAREQVGRVATRRVVRQDLVGEVLEDDGLPGHPGRLPDDLARVGPLDGQLGEGLVDLLGRPELGELRVDDPGVDGLGDGDEPGLAVERDEGEGPALGGAREGGRQRRAVPAAELDDQTGRPDVVEVRDVRREVRVVGRQGDPGREDELAAAEQPGDVDELAHVRPPDPTVEPGGAGDDLGATLADGGQLEDLAHRGEHQGSFRRPRDVWAAATRRPAGVAGYILIAISSSEAVAATESLVRVRPVCQDACPRRWLSG
jgi:hypothetical protein